MHSNQTVKRQTKNMSSKEKQNVSASTQPQFGQKKQLSNKQPKEDVENNIDQQKMMKGIQTAEEDFKKIIQDDGQIMKEREEMFYKNKNIHKPEIYIFDSIKILVTELQKQLIFTKNMINGKKQLQKQSFVSNIWQILITLFEVLKNVLHYPFYKNQQQLLISQDISKNSNLNLAISEINDQDYLKNIQKMYDQQFVVKDKFLQLIKQFSNFTQKVCDQIKDQQSQLTLKEKEIKRLQEEIKNFNKDKQNLQQQVEQLKQQNGQKLKTSNDSKTIQNYDSNFNQYKQTKNNHQQNLNINSKINSQQIKLKTAKQTQQNDVVSPNISEISEIAMLLSKSDTGKKFIMKILFPKRKQTKFYEQYYQKELDLTIVDTDCFDFEEIDERERQIQQFKKIFSDEKNQYLGIWIVVEFERIDIMKRNVMEIYKYVRGLGLSISMIVTNFQLRENQDEDQNLINSKFAMFNFKQIVFVDNEIGQEEMINQLKPTIFEYQRMKSVPIVTKDTIFEDDDPEFEKQLLQNLAQTMLRA